MKLKIESDGTAIGTRIVDVATGFEVEQVTAVEWRIESGGIATARIELARIAVDIEGEAGE